MRWEGEFASSTDDGYRWLTVIGVCKDVHQNQASAKEIAPVLYLPYGPVPPAMFSVAVRTAAPPETLAEAIGRKIQTLDPDVTVTSVITMTEVLRQAHWMRRVFGSMFAIFGVVSAALAGLGVYSVVAYAVEHDERTRIRRATADRGHSAPGTKVITTFPRACRPST
jgi:putative ABC transport system permease protein